MRKILFLTVLLISFCPRAAAQDLIVTDANDSINARITKENKKIIYFDFMKAGEFRSTLLPRSQVKEYQKGFYGISEVPNDAKKSLGYDGEHFRFDAHAGSGIDLAGSRRAIRW